jgi:hypothetical protein
MSSVFGGVAIAMAIMAITSMFANAPDTGGQLVLAAYVAAAALCQIAANTGRLK